MRKLFTMMGMGLLLAVPTFAMERLPGDAGSQINDDDSATLTVTAEIGNHVKLVALDNEIVFGDDDGALAPTSLGWKASVGTYANEAWVPAASAANDGQAYIEVESNRRLIVEYSTGSAQIKGGAYGDVLDLQFQTVTDGIFAPASSPVTGAIPDAAWVTHNGQPGSWGTTDGNSQNIGVERAKASKPTAKLWVRAAVYRHGVLDAMDTYTTEAGAPTVTIQYANANGSMFTTPTP